MSTNPMARAAALTPAVTHLRDEYNALEQTHVRDTNRSEAVNAERAAVRALAKRARRYAERLEVAQADLLDALRTITRPAETGAPE